MAGNNQNTFIQIPMDVTNPLELRRFLDKLVEQLDVAFGNRGDDAFVSDLNLEDITKLVNEHSGSIETLLSNVGTLLSNVGTLEGDVGNLQDSVGTLEGDVGTLLDVHKDTEEPTGFIRQSPNTMGILALSTDGTKTINKDGHEVITIKNDGTYIDGSTAVARELKLIPYDGNDIIIYIRGTKYTLSESQSIVLPNESGLYFIYFDIINGAVQLQYNTTFSYDYFEDSPIVATVYGNAASQELVNFGDERHGITMDGFTHRYLHFTRGTEYGNGMGISFVADATTTEYNYIASGTAYDEDIFIQAPQQTIAPFAYLLGSGNTKFWEITNSDTKFGYFNGTAYSHYNKYDSATDTWSLETMNTQDKDYSYCIIALTNNIEYPYIKLMGQEGYTNKSEIADAINSEVNNLLTEGLPSPEFLPIYAFIIDKEGRLEENDKGTFVLDLRLPPVLY